LQDLIAMQELPVSVLISATQGTLEFAATGKK